MVLGLNDFVILMGVNPFGESLEGVGPATQLICSHMALAWLVAISAKLDNARLICDEWYWTDPDAELTHGLPEKMLMPY
jgi:hypothetical protein